MALLVGIRSCLSMGDGNHTGYFYRTPASVRLPLRNEADDFADFRAASHQSVFVDVEKIAALWFIDWRDESVAAIVVPLDEFSKSFHVSAATPPSQGRGS